MITLKNVSKWYGHFQVLTDCSTEVKKGEVVVVCGPSGSGKSTLIKTVNGLEPVQQGELPSMVSWLTIRKPIWQSCVPASGWCSSISSCSPICRLLKT
ncbi:glutamate/aspartate ABC transporter ATP-binding protein [Escherichia coli]|uniref:Glutamate/aspartate ABC transporter ATP-binding protein n=1 Tax=Escherichia coli TaxID=562 RepID=A0A3S4M8S1_ECOLX|nr:glutamate/aspartate ABC transporter ATP-binding protein [Escherichia coli]